MTDKTDDILKWDVRQRLAVLEASVLWEGSVTTGALTRRFGISRGQASKDFSRYHQIAPNNLRYDPFQKAYFATKTFEPKFMNGSAEEYMLLLEAGHELGNTMVLPITPSTQNVTVLQVPRRNLNLMIFRDVHHAIRHQCQLRIRYQSLSSPTAKNLVIEPHSMAHDGFRWHVRAYSETHEEFRDFVIGRILKAGRTFDRSEHSAEDDVEWQTMESFTIKAHPGLEPLQKKAIEEDYGMKNGRLTITTRKALKLYHLRMLRVDQESLSEHPHIQQIVLDEEA